MKEVVPIHKAALENLQMQGEHDSKAKPNSCIMNESVFKPLRPHTPRFVTSVFYPALIPYSQKQVEQFW